MESYSEYFQKPFKTVPAHKSQLTKEIKVLTEELTHLLKRQNMGWTLYLGESLILRKRKVMRLSNEAAKELQSLKSSN